eukprot:COSAG01_NODE_19982_length_978_cov_1.348123_2_plen_204_part_01
MAESTKAGDSLSGNCAVDVDECQSKPCKNAAKCDDSSTNSSISAHAYRCSCKAGYANGACAYAFITQYSGQCKIMESESRAGYSGNCDLDINECTSSPCKNTALCEDSTQAGSTVAADAYRCKCAAGFANGACGYAFITQYKAACSVLESRVSKTYSGNCDQDVDECKSSPCQNGANCTHSAVAGSVGHHSYSCACNAGYASGM